MNIEALLNTFVFREMQRLLDRRARGVDRTEQQGFERR